MKKNSSLLLQMSRMDEENKALRGKGGSYEVRELQEENARLRKALSQLSNLPQEIFSEIEELKRENQTLRKDTVRLLKKVDRVVWVDYYYFLELSINIPKIECDIF